MKVIQVYRKKNSRSFSIEHVFFNLRKYFLNKVDLIEQESLTRSATPVGILRNLLFFLTSKKGEVYHVTGDIHYAIFAYPRSKSVLTVHDCVFLNSGNTLRKYIFKKLWLQWPISYARIVTTVSEKSKREILAHVKCNPDKIRVIPNSVSEDIHPVQHVFNEELPVILFIGTKENKNLLRTIESLTGISCMLDIVGVLDERQVNALTSSGLYYRNSYNLTANELAAKYAECDMVLFPSVYEGFGLPILESQAAGKPLVTSRISPLQEVAGSKACLVDPLSVESIRNGVLQIISNPSYREMVVAAGLNNVKNYLPQTVANMYFEIYNEILERK